MPMTRIMREFPRPQIEIESTDYGMRVGTFRRISGANTHVRVTNLVFPTAFIIPQSRRMTITQSHVPIHYTSHHSHAMSTSFGPPVKQDETERQRLTIDG